MKMAYILIVAGLVCIVAGVYFLCANHKDNESVSEAVVHTKEKVEETIEQSEENRILRMNRITRIIVQRE